MSEAAAAGLRLIAPDHSAYREYLDSSIARMISARQVPATRSHEASVVDLFADSEWWQPDELAAADYIASALTDEGRPDAAARERMASRFSWKAAARRLIAVLTELHEAHGVVF
jgi:glycosyltransferase involved in cell wall biosynthesis